MADVKHNIILSYLLNTGSSAGKVDSLAKKMSGLASIASRAQTAAIGFLGGRALAKSFIGYNMEIENSVTALATTMFGFGKAKTFNEGMAESTKLVGEYREIAKKSLGESSDFIDMHQTLQGTLLSQGVAYEKLRDITVGATVASQLFGEEAGMTALDVKQMAMGTMSAKDRVGGLLVGMVAASKGWKNFGYEQFNKLDPAKRIELLQEAVNSPALKQAADQMSKSFAGQWSTAMDNVKQILGDVGLPIFRQITAELVKAGDWIEKNKDKVAEWTKAVGGGLKDAFSVLATTFKFIADHSEVLITVAKAWAAVKIGQAMTGGLAGLRGLAAGGTASMGQIGGADVYGPVQQGLKAQAMAFTATAATWTTGVLQAASAGVALGTVLKDLTGGTTAWADRMGNLFGNKTYQSVRALERWDEALRTATAASGKTGIAGDRAGYSAVYAKEISLAKAVISSRASLEAAKQGGDINALIMANAVYQKAFDTAMGMGLYRSDVSNEGVAAFIANRQSKIGRLAPRLGPDLPSTTETPLGGAVDAKSQSKGTNVNVTISRIEVQNDDPDRFVFDMMENFRKSAKNPSMARNVGRRG